MNGSESRVPWWRRRPVLAFFLLAHAWSWACWIPTIVVFLSNTTAANGSRATFEAFTPLMRQALVLGVYGPSAAALLLTGLNGGRAAVRCLLGRLFRWRAGPGVHAVAWLAPSVFFLFALALYGVQSDVDLGELNWSRASLIPAAFALALAFGPLGEELGWRGYALPRLQGTHGALVASLIIGTAWALWHLPLFWAPAGTMISGGPATVPAVGKYLLGMLALSIVQTWIFNNSRGSVLLPIIFHATFNAGFARLLFPQLPGDLSRAVLDLQAIPATLLVLALLVVYGPGRLSKAPLRNEVTEMGNP